MKKNRILAIGLVVTMMFAVVGCGDKKETSTVETTSEVAEETLSVEVEESSEVDVPVQTVEEEDTHTPKESDYVEYLDFYGPENHENREILVDEETFEQAGIEFAYLPESVNLYYDDGCPAGYTKPGIEVQIDTYSDEWYSIYLDMDETHSKSRLVKAEDFDAVAVRENDTETQNVEENTNTENTNTESTSSTTNTATEVNTTSVDNTPVSSEPVVETPVVESNKYTPDEAVAIYRNYLESNGMTWDPSIKEFASWGTGWLDLSDPEGQAKSALQGYQYGDGVGNSDTRYYFEVTGSDNDYVYFTKWNCD